MKFLKEDLLGEIFLREHDPVYHNHSFETCGGPEAITSTTMFKKCGVKASSVWQNGHMPKIDLGLLCPSKPR